MRSAVFPEPVGPVTTESLPIGKLILRSDKVKKVSSTTVLPSVRTLSSSGPGSKEGCFPLLGSMVSDDEDCWPVFHLKDAFSKPILVASSF